MIPDLSSFHFILLFFTGLCAGFVDSIAGGGGLISLPVLLSVGLPPQMALGTNKLQGSFGTLSAAWNFIRTGIVKLDESIHGIVFTFMGAVLGAWSIQQIQAGFIRHIIPVMLLFVFFYTLFSKNLGRAAGRPRMGRNLFFMVFGLGLGFYDGFFGPGTGSFWTGALLILLGLDMTKASGTTRIMNFVSNIVALSVFIIGRNVLYSAGLTMAAGQIVGARIGSGMAIKRGAAFIRPIFLTVVFFTIVRLIYKNYF
ncbi:TSUP family transporter [Desulfospira joergensenii]|uniref:TSUP family transporter n=1 Tax=Desulfospira joergensenii TaxID=53329 RepID=UPI0003B4AD42|nr:TSUP family transporter [Desulfospira joergensenii]